MPPKKDNADVEAAEVARIEKLVADMSVDPSFVTGDARDIMLGVIKSAVDWSKFDERRQRDINASVMQAARDIVGKVVAAIASEGAAIVDAKLKQVTIKGDGAKVTLEVGFDHDAIVTLGEMTDQRVQIRLADINAFDGQRAEAPVDPDQPELMPGPDGDDDLVEAADPPKGGEGVEQPGAEVAATEPA